ncbi:MAG: hypothetical protein CME62_03680 [Halobacteriovoraceae bacterium]|nr:hypothetical protein [Halobacteriovoraceae bacterium]
MSLALIIFWAAFPCQAQSKNELQLSLGDSVNIYSEKAYRRDNGTYFEAVGNVIIISGQDTLYGEKATLNSKTGDITLEGSVRYIGKNITIYGSRIALNMNSNKLEMDNARMITTEFSIVASKIKKISENKYFAKEAEFTTCRDCVESWMISGQEVHLEIGEYVQIYHALAKIKGTDVLYLPYIALPVKTTRESGLLFPQLNQRAPEGFIYEQPVFWAIDEDKDATFTPTFLGERGLGTNLQYRQVFAEKNWLEINSKLVMDEIYQPREQNTSASNRHYFRNYFELENHSQWSNSFSHHVLIQGSGDTDFFRDFNYYTDDRLLSNDYGIDFFINQRFDQFSLSLESSYKRNILVDDPTEFDKQYVQTLPTVNLSVMPQLLYQGEHKFLHKISSGFKSRFSNFKQVEEAEEEDAYLRNAHRIEAYPYVHFSLLNWGPLNLSSNISIDYQEYNFDESEEQNFSKYTNLISTEVSFTMDRIFGLAYEETYSRDEFREQDLMKFKNQSGKEPKKNDKLIGELPSFESALARERFKVTSSSYRHAQEFKFIHHQILASDESGNERFLAQIQEEEGWFDYRDAIIEDLDELQSNETRTTIPLKNTFEFQWNNSLIKKTPKNYIYSTDEKYLKDQFNYSTIGYFELSQGLLLEESADSVEDKLTRLYLNSGYNVGSWRFKLTDYYFHQTSDNILTLHAQKRFERLSLLGKYDHNSFTSSNLKVIQTGFQFRPHDILGFSYLKSFDLDANEDISSIYQVDFMPHNNCWIVNLNYRETLIEQRFSINWEFNFGNEEFKEYRTNFWNFTRI